MHALIGVFDMDRALFAEQVKTLKERIVPMVSQSPGFVAGYWSYDREKAKSHSYIVLTDEAAALKFSEEMRTNTKASKSGVKLESLTLAEVLAEARK